MPTAMTISGNGASITLTPLSIKPGVNALDSANSGRDNSSGDMFRDKLADKLKYTIEMPANMTNAEVAAILNIILAPQFTADVPDPKTGSYTNGNKAFYCAGCETEIKRIISSSNWVYKSWSFNMVEM